MPYRLNDQSSRHVTLYRVLTTCYLSLLYASCRAVNGIARQCLPIASHPDESNFVWCQPINSVLCRPIHRALYQPTTRVKRRPINDAKVHALGYTQPSREGALTLHLLSFALFGCRAPHARRVPAGTSNRERYTRHVHLRVHDQHPFPPAFFVRKNFTWGSLPHDLRSDI